MSKDRFTISRKVWARGAGTNKLLYNQDGERKQCCLGIYLTHLGEPDDRLRNIGSPSQVIRSSDKPLPKEALWLLNNNGKGPYRSELSGILMVENDSVDVSEKRIAELFDREWITVDFVD